MSSTEPPRISARDALEYATHDELLKLYGLLVAGWVGMLVGQFAINARSSLVSFVGVFVVLGGVIAFLVGLVAIVHKLLVES